MVIPNLEQLRVPHFLPHAVERLIANESSQLETNQVVEKPLVVILVEGKEVEVKKEAEKCQHLTRQCLSIQTL